MDSCAVYPRWRGEHIAGAGNDASSPGLSPLARGTPPPDYFLSVSVTVYPRWRGEHPKPAITNNSAHGLSPLARGTRKQTAVLWLAERFIPAGAGNTFITHPVITRTPVYPRWRGEHFSHIFSMSCAAGLSPLARGTHKHCSYVNWINRFIPAGAGNTQTGSFSTARPAVYPRWRGEHLRDNFIEQVTGGLSPLARGTPLRSPREYPAHRFIPAGAGNTRRGG